MATTFDRLVILGLDGATWTVLDPMRRRGLMPNLDALLARSAHGTLRSIVPPVTSAAWTTVMTGCGPARHGVFDHRYYDTAAGQMKVNHSGRIRVPTIWRLLSDAGRSVACLNVPGLYPPPRVRGVVVSGMDAPHLEELLFAEAGLFVPLLAELGVVAHLVLEAELAAVPAALDVAKVAGAAAEIVAGRCAGAAVAGKATRPLVRGLRTDEEEGTATAGGAAVVGEPPVDCAATAAVLVVPDCGTTGGGSGTALKRAGPCADDMLTLRTAPFTATPDTGGGGAVVAVAGVVRRTPEKARRVDLLR